MESTTQSHRRPVPHRRRAVWLLAGLVALLLSVGGSSTALAKPSRAGAVGGTLTWALQTNPASLFDAYYFSAEGSTFFSLVQDHMLAPGTFGQPTTGEGAVVQSWKATSPTRYVYTIKKGIRFSDGSTLTAADVAFSMNVHRDPKTGSKMGDFFGNVVSIRRSGNQVIVVAEEAGLQLAVHAGRESGPRLLGEGLQGEGRRTSARRAGCRSAPARTSSPVLAELTRRARPEPVLQGQEVSVGHDRLPGDPRRAGSPARSPERPDRRHVRRAEQLHFHMAEGIRTCKVGTYVSGGWRGFSIDIEDGPFQDIHVRRAIAYSLNKAGINEALTSSRGVVLNGLPPLDLHQGLLPAEEINAALKKVADVSVQR